MNDSIMEDQEDEEVLLPGQKPKTLPCRYCNKRFRRLEHVQRHERTHTKEKPFKCDCGKTFGRRDLLVRHEKLVHMTETTRERSNSTASKAGLQKQSQQQQPHEQQPYIPQQQQQQQPAYQPPPSSLQQHPYQPSSLSQQTYQHHVQPQPATPSHTHSSLHVPNMLSAPSLIDPDLLLSQTPTYGHRTPGCSLDLLSDAANHLASHELMNMSSSIPQMHDSRYHDPQPNNHYSNHQMHEQPRYDDSQTRDFPPMGSGFQEDYNMFLDDVGGMSNYFLPLSAFDDDVPGALFAKPEYGQTWSGHQESRERLAQDTPANENGTFSRFGSRLPSLQPGESQEEHNYSDNAHRNGPAWKISSQDLREIQRKLDDFNNVLPKGFVLPSRHTLSRFLEGYISGFHEHLPFLHLPTISAAAVAPELLLALVAVGAQYRFESHRGNGLWYAAKAVALEQVRRRNSQQVMEIMTPSAHPQSNPMSASPHASMRSNIEEVYQQGYANNPSFDHDNASNDPRLRTSQARLETIQALFLLMAMGTWAPRALLRDALSLQSALAVLVREQGLTEMGIQLTDDISWEDWIRVEGDKRTKFIIYCFFNLHCISYDMPPPLLTSEILLNLPQSAKEWKAESAVQWSELRRTTPPTHVSFHEVLASLFAKSPSSTSTQGPPMSSLGNYILIHAIIQHIFFLRQTSNVSHPATQNNGLLERDQDVIGNALKQWQAAWERTPESNLDPSSKYGPVAFNSTALLRLAYIRLHSDLGPCRRLDSRDPVRIAHALKDNPLLQRGGRLARAVLQSAHALSIPVKIGVNYVARTQTFSWSIQHGLCNLECAFLLSKWLETIAQTPLDLTAGEQNLLDMVRSMLEETEFALDAEPQTQTTSPNPLAASPYPTATSADVSMQADSNIDTSLMDLIPAKSEGRVTRSKVGKESSSSNPTTVTNSSAASEANDTTVDDEKLDTTEADETGGAEEITEPTKVLTEEEERNNIKRLGVAVVRLWAETFKGTHIFAIVKVIGASLEVYADLLEKECEA